MRNIGVSKHIDKAGRFKIPKELLIAYNLKSNSLIRIYQKEKNLVLEAAYHHCIFCDSRKNIHQYKDKYICKSCIIDLKKICK